MFLACDKITHLHRLLFSWSYDQENDTLPIDFLGVLKSCYGGSNLVGGTKFWCGYIS